MRLLKQLDDFQERLEIEKVERLEREALTLKKVKGSPNPHPHPHPNPNPNPNPNQVTDAIFPMQEQITEERGRRESMLGHLRDEQDQINELRDKPDTQFKHDLITRMVANPNPNPKPSPNTLSARHTPKGHQANRDPHPGADIQTPALILTSLT